MPEKPETSPAPSLPRGEPVRLSPDALLSVGRCHGVPYNDDGAAALLPRRWYGRGTHHGGRPALPGRPRRRCPPRAGRPCPAGPGRPPAAPLVRLPAVPELPAADAAATQPPGGRTAQCRGRAAAQGPA